MLRHVNEAPRKPSFLSRWQIFYQRLLPAYQTRGFIFSLFDDIAASDSISIDYWPNQAISEKKVTHTFYIDQ